MAQPDPILIAHFEKVFAGLFQGGTGSAVALDLAQGVADLGFVLPAAPSSIPFAGLDEQDVFDDLTSVNEMGSGEFDYYRDDEDGALLVRHYGDDELQPGKVTAIGRVSIQVVDVSAEYLPKA